MTKIFITFSREARPVLECISIHNALIPSTESLRLHRSVPRAHCLTKCNVLLQILPGPLGVSVTLGRSETFVPLCLTAAVLQCNVDRQGWDLKHSVSPAVCLSLSVCVSIAVSLSLSCLCVSLYPHSISLSVSLSLFSLSL